MRGVSLAAVVACTGACATPAPDPSITTADIVFPKIVTVTEGGSTAFRVGVAPVPISELGGVVNTADSSVASVTPDQFVASASADPVMMTLYGTDDMMPDALNRGTTFTGHMDGDDAQSGGGLALVVDKDSLNVIADPWWVIMTSASTATFDVRLTQPPSSSMTVTLELGSDSTSSTIITFEPTTLVFGPTDYNVPQSVTVTSGSLSGTASIGLRPPSPVLPQGVFVVID